MTSEPRASATTRMIPVGDVDLAVTEYGTSGPTLVLLHGIGSRGVSWWPVVDPLAEQFRLIVPDFRGHGASAKPDNGYLIEDYARDLSGLVDALELERPLIMGHSLGGIVTLQWAVSHPNRAARIALEDTPLRSDPNPAPLFDGWLALARMTPEAATAYFKQENPGWSDEDCRLRAESITATAPAVFTELRDAFSDSPQDRIAPLAAIQSPVLFVHGDIETGGRVFPEDIARFAATVPHARIERMPEGSHSLHRDSTERFLALVVPFLTAGESLPR